ncbi:hypothetical protein AMJ52_03790 [candidate division TA06 bacterium DG_78]|uniref:DUF3098 domain-containing protein n=1 Tax=candidate division TA06 bacterium DG_78 TaxID=1703772 RepID=A0A0S7YF93_UNCT6|nr:MAG: hypothetical protein AMJ52_03790 [candidate division TA06 bacterium DG_78]
MAKKDKKKKKEKKEKGREVLADIQFTKKSNVLFGIGLLVVILGFILLATGSIVLAPILLVVGYIVFFPLGILVK